MVTRFLVFLFFYFCASVLSIILNNQIEGSQTNPSVDVESEFPLKRLKRYASKVTYPCSVSGNAGQAKLVLTEESHDISLECVDCQPKKTDVNVKPHIQWAFRPLESRKYQILKVDHNNTFLSPQNSLLLEGLTIERGGFYRCLSHGGTFISAYRVDVVKKEPREQVFVNKNYQPKAPAEMKENNLLVFTLWGSWSSCSRCDARGYRKRVGLCTVKQLSKSESTLPVDIPLFQKYPIGIPCRSTALLKVIAHLEPIKTRKSETEVEYCWEPCFEAQKIETVTDSNGNVIEVLKPKDHILSVHKVKPTIAPLVIRKTVFHDLGKLLILKCPTEKHYDLGNDIVMWQNNSQVLDAITLWKDTNDRVHIDVLNRLVIEKTELWDSAAYSCWRKQQHLATIKVVIVYQRTNSHDYKIYIHVAGVSLTLVLLIYVAIDIIKNRNKI